MGQHRNFLGCRGVHCAIFALLLVMLTPAIAQDAPIPAHSVKAQPLSQLLHHSELRANAEVVPAQRSTLSAETTARVTTTPVEVGQRVERGDTLVTLDQRDAELRVAAARAALAAAQAAVELAQVRLARAQELAEKSFVSPDELKERQALSAQDQATLALRQSELDIARRELERCTIKAPFAGWVTTRDAQLGQLAMPGTALIQLVADGQAELSVKLDPALAGDLSPASQVHYIDERQRRLALTWLRTGAVIDPASRKLEARLGFAGDSAPPGSSGAIVWRAADGRLPPEFLVRRDGQLGIFVAEAGRARFHPLPGADAGRPATIDQNLQAPVITEGQQHLNDGDRISIAQ